MRAENAALETYEMSFDVPRDMALALNFDRPIRVSNINSGRVHHYHYAISGLTQKHLKRGFEVEIECEPLSEPFGMSDLIFQMFLGVTPPRRRFVFTLLPYDNPPEREIELEIWLTVVDWADAKEDFAEPIANLLEG